MLIHTNPIEIGMVPMLNNSNSNLCRALVLTALAGLHVGFCLLQGFYGVLMRLYKVVLTYQVSWASKKPASFE